MLSYWLPDGAGAGSLGLVLAGGRAWIMADVCGQPLVAVRDEELEPPSGRELEVRGPGVWAALHCETPWLHWSGGLEAFALALEDPAGAAAPAGVARGDVVPLGFDLEWEAAQDPVWLPGGYGQGCEVHGEVLVGTDRQVIDGWGHRHHWWGTFPWEQPGAALVGGRVEDRWVTPDGTGIVGTPVWRAPWPTVERAFCRLATPAGMSGWGWVSRSPGP